MISPATIDKIRDAARIEDTVGERIELRRRGSSLVACCPFHNEKTPSFHVHPAKNYYHCFGCQAHGDSIRFVMEFEHKTYPEAVRILAERYHITIEERELSPEEKQLQDDRQSVRRVLAATLEWAKQQFNSEEGQRYWRLLQVEWGIREDTAVKYELGCIPNHADLILHLTQSGFEDRYIKLSGLCDVDFSESVLVPFFTMSNDLHTLGAIPASDSSKMIGLPPSGMWNSDNCLFGIREAIKRIPKDASILWVHGAIDAMKLSQSGQERVVATPLSGLTEYMLKKVLGRFANRLTLVCPEHYQFNPQWVNRCAWIMQQGMTLSILLQPADLPLEQCNQQPVDFLQQQLERVAQIPASSPDRAKQLEVFLRLLLCEQDNVTRDCYLHAAADMLSLPLPKLQQVLNSFISPS